MDTTVISVDIGSFLVILFGALNLIVLGPIAWILKSAVSDLKRIEKEHDELEKTLPLLYVQKNDYIRDIAEIKALLQKIFSVLDGKADK